MKGKEGQDNHANNQEILSFLQDFNVGSVKSAFSSVVGLAQGVSEAYEAIKSMTRALDYLNIQRQKDKNFLHKIKTAELLRNPAHFREFLMLNEWQNKNAQGEESNLYTVGREQLGITFENEEKAF
ncbi:MAG: hypothetical protein LBU27_05395 [Candidatus Peribacteria bacterium]|nr:hypothetical protein [Candidatus Peribacteria bacterium]